MFLSMSIHYFQTGTLIWFIFSLLITRRFPINWGDLSKEEQIQENNESADATMGTNFDQSDMDTGMVTPQETAVEPMVMTE